ncbi:MAG TPA: protein translocase subunit SecD [Firmicutes bacterium]|nr:protein translocase subunit SecD [Bacillota bacterium]
MIPRDERWKAIVILVLVIAGAAAMALRPLHLGLDLRGGTSIVLQAKTEDTGIGSDTMERLIGVMERRVNQLGLSESTVQRVGANRINIELPGYSDADAAVAALGRTAMLIFADEFGNVILTGAELSNATYTTDNIGRPAVSVVLNAEGARKFADFTRRNVGRPVIIKLDEEVISQATIQEPITDGKGIITGRFSVREATELSALLRAGALPVPVEVVEYRTVGPTLGQQSVNDSLRAAIIGLVGTIIFMLLIYRGLGLVAALALTIYAVLVTGAMMGLGAVLTLPGIAGLILSIGMAVDGNILIFERAREEYKNTGTIPSSVRKGFNRAFWAIFDSNTTTFLAALILFALAVGTVKGYAVTLGLGVLASFLTAITASRILSYLLLATPLRDNAKALGLTTYLKQRFFDIVGHRRIWFTISSLLVVVSIISLLAQGLNFGLDFAGGTVVGIDINRTLSVEEIEEFTAAADIGSVNIQPSENSFMLKAREIPKDSVTSLVDKLNEAGLEASISRQEYVGPVIGQEVRSKAILALLIALLGQIIYVSIRFEWRFAISAVAALFHNVIIVVGLFSILQREVDSTFLAALLTIIGYSINDTVVVFDRIRENRKTARGELFADTVNRSINETIARSLNTGFSVILVLTMLLLFGGSTLNSFALALLTGVLLGTYSSIFAACPLVAVWHGASGKGAGKGRK